MTNKMEIYKCKICGNVIQVLIDGAGELVCCGQEMKLLEAKREINELGEKHAVKVDIIDNKKIAHVPHHPMINEHYIQFIEAIDSDKNEIHLKYFNPNEKPEFDISNFSENLKLTELCNIHELWGE